MKTLRLSTALHLLVAALGFTLGVYALPEVEWMLWNTNLYGGLGWVFQGFY